jgi:hypothetical protein
MTHDSILERLRAANPSRTTIVADEALFDSIVAAPIEFRRGGKTATPRRRTRRLQVVVIVAAALAIGVGAAWATGRDVLQLFDSNPAAGDPADQPASGLWHQIAIPSTVRRAGVLSIPHFGQLELWYAETEQHGWCGAFRLPDGSWAGTKGSSGGTAPGCYPSRTQVNEAGDSPVFVITGFDYYDVDIDARGKGGSYWRVLYGVTEGKVPAARIVDTISGRRAPILSGKVFAIAFPEADPEGRGAPTRLWHLVAYDQDGKVIADADNPLTAP